MLDVRFVLVRTASGGNVGASARALANTGFGPPWLVATQAWSTEEAERLAHGARDLLAQAPRCESLREAVADCRWVVGTSRRVGRKRVSPFTPRELGRTVTRTPERRPLAIVFGPEADGLSSAELALCQDLVQIPAASAQPSYNLAQAVLVVAYEIFTAGLEAIATRDDARRDEVDAAALEAMYAHVENMLHAIGFVRPDTAPAKMRALRQILDRARLRPKDVQLVRGVCRQALWATGKPDAPTGPARKRSRGSASARPPRRGTV